MAPVKRRPARTARYIRCRCRSATPQLLTVRFYDSPEPVGARVSVAKVAALHPGWFRADMVSHCPLAREQGFSLDPTDFLIRGNALV